MPKNQHYDIPMLDNLNKQVMSKWENLLKCLGLNEYHESNYRVTSCCNIHGGDNDSALNLYLEGSNSFPGYWICNTQNCQDVFGKNVIGLTRGILSRQRLGWSSPNDKMISFQQTIDYLLKFLNTNYSSLQSSGSNNNQLFTNQINNIFARPTIECNNNITREQIRQSLDIPAQYYLDRGYSSTILSAYDIGKCTNPKKMMYDRVVVPIYDENYNYVGCTGRSIFEKCGKCKQYHNPQNKCTNKKKSKWLHSYGLKGSEYLYNYYNAKKYIKQSQIMIIVESPGDVWKLEESGIHNSVAIFKTAISQGQFNLINSSGALSLIVLLNNDNAGNIGMKKIQQQCQRLYRLYYPKIEKNDIGDMQIDEITVDILPYLEKIQKEFI